MSQSPQTGQFNSYIVYDADKILRRLQSLNPLKRVNSILTSCIMNGLIDGKGLNPLKRVNSILTDMVSH